MVFLANSTCASYFTESLSAGIPVSPIIQDVDEIFINGLRESGLYDSVWQAGSILLPVKSVGVMGDERTYEDVVALRAVSSTDGMTADWCHLPYEFLGQVSNEIINKVKGVNRVVYDIMLQASCNNRMGITIFIRCVSAINI